MDWCVGEYLLRTVTLPFRVGKDRVPDRVPDREPDRALLIVETRPLFFLPHVVATAVRTHPGWAVYVAGTPAVHALLASQCVDYEHVHRITLDTSPRMTTQQYSRLMLTRRVWEVIHEEHVLVFQSDCVLVRSCPDELLTYDFVGAVCGSLDKDRFIMNGGLSLRRRSAMLRAIDMLQKHPRLHNEPEDVAVCEVMRAHPREFTVPSLEECDAFAIESRGDPNTAVGMHGTDKYYAPPELVARLLASA